MHGEWRVRAAISIDPAQLRFTALSMEGGILGSG